MPSELVGILLFALFFGVVIIKYMLTAKGKRALIESGLDGGSGALRILKVAMLILIITNFVFYLGAVQRQGHLGVHIDSPAFTITSWLLAIMAAVFLFLRWRSKR